ncbi:adenylyl-sulfate kinase [Kitasatospora sp. NBC_01287]|uniref:adenylyl-sulfate kinase n=1 Tax=Kitasatospora sp. NBC_01287 TaxID=2903573 RepID=UPI00225A7791|nr:adenylyl-sulfate kinase [Kitasatospora sp. NBC_01287]MCX4746944.1 adenylyl-sulfate kinase [Kitasatospora sp. NBC_01287]
MRDSRWPRPPGATVWLTGLPSAGKSTVAGTLADDLARRGRRVEVLDTDQARRFLPAGLGLSRADRGTSVRRIGRAAQVLARNGVLVLVPVLAPYAEDRAAVARGHAVGGVCFLEVHVAAPLAVCAERDVQGLYARHADGMLKGLVGIDAPYEPPVTADLRLETHLQSVEESVAALRAALLERGLL